MRITQSMYYKSLYGTNNSQLQTKLFDVNKQIASGIKIQYASDDVSVFAETMRLDNEITSLAQVTKSTQSGYKVSNQSDEVLNEFETSLNRIKTLLIQSANETNSVTSLDAIAAELRGQESNLKNLANTSINGQYLFSGSAVDIKPISEDGTYNGNDVGVNAFLGSNTKQQYNLTGADLFLGEESLTRREVTTNVKHTLNAPTDPASTSVNPSTTMQEFMGDIGSPNTHYFYVRGIQSDGTAFQDKITMNDSETLEDLADHIGNAFGNTIANDVVNVSVNDNGQFVISDKLKGSSKLDFHIVGATDFSGGGAANVTDIDDLDSGDPTYGASGLYVKEFIKSGFNQSAKVPTAGNDLEGLLYDRTNFTVKGNSVSSNVPQINKDTNAFATASTKILDVASGSSLDAKQFEFSGTNVSGTAFDATIDFASTGSTFTVAGTTYDIFNVASTRSAVDADEMTYQQLMDVMNMVATNSLPAAVGTNINPSTGLATTTAAEEYDIAISTSNLAGTTTLSYDGKIEFGDLNVISTKVTMSLHDANSGDFTQPASVMSFNANNTLTVRDAKTDFFKTIDEAITAVENHSILPDYTLGDGRNVGISNSLSLLDDLQDHLFRSHSMVGANSNALTTSLERTAVLEIGTKTLRSQVIDTDLAEASLSLTQLTLNYEAMLSTVGRISKLSLVNYL